MGIFDFWKPKKTTKEKLIPPIDDDPQWKTISIGGFGLEEKSYTLLQEYISWTYANISAIAEAVSDIKIQLFKVKKDEVEEIKEHPVLELIHRPNSSMTKREFFYLLTIYKLLTGESPIRIRNVKNPTELWPLNPLNLRPLVGKSSDGFEMIIGYEFDDTFNGELKQRKLKPEEIIYIKNTNPNNMWRGYGVVEAAQNSIDTMHYSELYNLNFFKNSAVPFTVLYTDQKLTPQVVERLKASWNSSYRGVQNAFKTAILESGLKIEKLQQSSKDMDFIEQQRFLRDKLMAMFKTTKIALGITEDVNRANAEASEYVFSKNCIRPKMASLIESLNEFLLPIFDPEGKLFLDFEDPTPKDRATLISEYSTAYNKWLTPNEIRKLEGYPDLDGGDEIWQPINLTPMSSPRSSELPYIPEDKEKPKVSEEIKPEEGEEIKTGYRVMKLKGKRKPIKDFSEQIANLNNRNIRIKLLKRDLELQLKKILKSKVKPKPVTRHEPKYKDMKTKSDTEKYLKTISSNSDKFEKKMNETFKWNYYQPQAEEIINNIKRKGVKFIVRRSKKIEKQIGDEFMFDQAKYVAVGIDLMTPLLEEIIKSQGSEAMLTVAESQVYSLMDAARKYLNQKPIKLAKSITETAYTRIRTSLAEGIKSGEGVRELTSRVLNEYKSLEVYQAENIARTEVTRATNFAAIDAFKQSGVVEGKEWVVVGDDRTCEFCMSMESEYNSQAALDDKYFKVGDTVNGVDGGVMEITFDDVEGPPLHNQCRCQLKSVEKLVTKAVENKEVKIEPKEDQLLKEIEDELEGIKRAKTSGIETEDTGEKGKK